MSLAIINDYYVQAGVLLNDVAAVRYTQGILKNALSQGIGDMYRLRPDLFLDGPFDDGLLTDERVITIPPMYRPALLDYVVGFCERMDQEESSSARATADYAKFSAKLTGGNVA